MNPVELVEYAYKIRDEQKLEWLTLCIPYRRHRGRYVTVIGSGRSGCRGQVIGDHTRDRDGALVKELIVSVQISELLIAAAKLVEHFESLALRYAQDGRDAEAEETMRQYTALQALLHNIPTTKGRPKRKPRKPKENARGA